MAVAALCEQPVAVKSGGTPKRISLGRGLRRRGEELGLKQAEVARQCKLSAERYGQYVRDEREPDFDTLDTICRVLRATPDELLGYVEHMGNTADLPVDTGTVAYEPIAFLEIRPGMGGGAYEDLQDAVTVLFPRRLIRERLRSRPEDLRLVEVEGPSMLPMLESGDQVLVDITKRNPSQPGIFCLWDGFGIVCKLVERVPLTDPPQVRIISANPLFRPNELTEEEAHIIGRVVWFSREL